MPSTPTSLLRLGRGNGSEGGGEGLGDGEELDDGGVGNPSLGSSLYWWISIEFKRFHTAFRSYSWYFQGVWPSEVDNASIVN